MRSNIPYQFREACRDWPEIRFEQHDLRPLPYGADSFDLVLLTTLSQKGSVAPDDQSAAFRAHETTEIVL
jgi:hypothetical protein